MAKSGLSKSIRKFIRKEKARIRREYLGPGEQKQKIEELHKKYFLDTSKTPNLKS